MSKSEYTSSEKTFPWVISGFSAKDTEIISLLMGDDTFRIDVIRDSHLIFQIRLSRDGRLLENTYVRSE